MTVAQLRRKLKRDIDALDARQLRECARRLRELREEEEATAELLAIPGFLQSVRRELRDVKAGRTTSVRDLRRK